jgi:DnaJ-class molecular chaperone
VRKQDFKIPEKHGTIRKRLGRDFQCDESSFRLLVVWFVVRGFGNADKEYMMGENILCPNCKGDGAVDVNEKCVPCKGTGQREWIDDWGKKVQIRCYPCRGSGKIKDKDTCNMCGGDGEITV